MIIRVHSTLRDAAGLRQIEATLPAPSTVMAALRYLAERAPGLASKLFDQSGSLSHHVTIFCNGRQIVFLQGLATPLLPTDTLDLFPTSHLQRVFAPIGTE
jgi:molybdopterin synthase sulfur carrier subunit